MEPYYDTPTPPTDSIRAMTIVCMEVRRGNTIRTVLCYIVYDSYAQ